MYMSEEVFQLRFYEAEAVRENRDFWGGRAYADHLSTRLRVLAVLPAWARGR
jgi:hypothetical protein